MKETIVHPWSREVWRENDRARKIETDRYVAIVRKYMPADWATRPHPCLSRSGTLLDYAKFLVASRYTVALRSFIHREGLT